MRRVAIFGIAAAAILFCPAAALRFLKPSVRRSDIITARVTRGTIDATIEASGTVLPLSEQIVPSPIDARIVRIDRRAGDHVNPGDSIVTLDASASRLELDRLDEKLEQKRNEALQLRLAIDERTAQLAAQLEQKRLDGEILRFKASQHRRLATEGLISTHERLATDTALRKCEIEIEQIKATAARNEQTAAAQLAAIARQVTMVEKERAQSQHELDRAMMRADRSGVLTSVLTNAGATLRRGDVVARIADLSSFRVTATLSDVHVTKLVIGAPVRVRIDETTQIEGHISNVSPRIDNGVATFRIGLATPAHPKLRNNLRVEVLIVTARHSGSLRVARGSLSGGRQDHVLVIRDDRAVRTAASFGEIGKDSIEVTGGLREGEEVIISDMSKYESADEIRIK